MGGRERESGREGKDRVKEKVVKLEGWGERVNRRRKKQGREERAMEEWVEEERKAKIHFLCRYKDLSRGRGHAATAQDPLYTHYD